MMMMMVIPSRLLLVLLVGVVFLDAAFAQSTKLCGEAPKTIDGGYFSKGNYSSGSKGYLEYAVYKCFSGDKPLPSDTMMCSTATGTSWVTPGDVASKTPIPSCSSGGSPAPAGGAAGGTTPKPESSDGTTTQAERDLILEEHNRWRVSVVPPAKKPIANLTWDPELAQQAKAWADQCYTSHDPNRKSSKYGSVGQNLCYGSFNLPWKSCISDMWAAERKNWTYGADPKSGIVVGHYTQIIWANTTAVGCAKKDCKTTIVMFCNYGPAGNVATAANGYKYYGFPYEKADTSSGQTPQPTPAPMPSPQPPAQPAPTPAPRTTPTPAPQTPAQPAPKTTPTPIPQTPATPQPKSRSTPAPQPPATPAPKPAPTPAPTSANDGSTEAERKEILDQHNIWRMSVDPPAQPPIANLTWDSDLALQARGWANRCSASHDPNLKLAKYGSVGQNLCSASYDMAWTRCISVLWAGELKDWTYGKGKTGSGDVGHYTQIIWADTKAVGCAKVKCSSNYVLFCNYGPAGNVASPANGNSYYGYPYKAAGSG